MASKKPKVQETNIEATPAVVEAPQAKVSIGKQVVNMIMSDPNMKNADILAKILQDNPTAKTSYACIAWYRSDLRKKGLLGPRVFEKKVKAETPQAEVVA